MEATGSYENVIRTRCSISKHGNDAKTSKNRYLSRFFTEVNNNNNNNNNKFVGL